MKYINAEEDVTQEFKEELKKISNNNLEDKVKQVIKDKEKYYITTTDDTLIETSHSIFEFIDNYSKKDNELEKNSDEDIEILDLNDNFGIKDENALLNFNIIESSEIKSNSVLENNEHESNIVSNDEIATLDYDNIVVKEKEDNELDILEHNNIELKEENNETNIVNENKEIQNKDKKKFNYMPFVASIPIILTLFVVRIIGGNDLNIELKGEQEVNVLQFGDYVEPGYVATDYRDGDITDKVIVKGTVDTSVSGIYILEYSITNSNNDTETVKRKVNVIENFGDMENKFEIIEVSGIPSKLIIEKINTLSNISKNINDFQLVIGMNSLISNNNYQDILSCNNKLIGHEASIISIYNYKKLGDYSNSSCFSNNKVLYFLSENNMIIKSINSVNDYNEIISNDIGNTFVFNKVIVQNGIKVDTSYESNNIAICSTGYEYKILLPNNKTSLNEYAIMMLKNKCTNGVLLNGSTLIKNNIIYGNGNNYYDSVMYFN